MYVVGRLQSMGLTYPNEGGGRGWGRDGWVGPSHVWTQ